MTTQAFPTLNGVTPSWADLEAAFSVYGGRILKTADFAAMSCSSTVEFGVKRGTGSGRKKARTTGQEDNEASITLYMSGYRALLRALMSKAPTKGGQVQVGIVAFDIPINWTPPGDEGIYSIVIRGCRLAGDSFSMAEGTDAQQVEVPLSTMQIVRIIDGKEVVLL